MSEEVEEVIGVQPITDLSEEDQKHYLWLWEKEREENRQLDVLKAQEEAAELAYIQARDAARDAKEAWSNHRRQGGGYYQVMSSLLPNGPHRLT
jgi:hypothetical protein